MEDVDEHLACRPVFSQFSHFSPAPGTPLYDRLEEQNRILTAIPFEDWHAFKQPWFIHPEFNLAEAEKIQEEAYRRDFHELGPSVMRFIEADLEGALHLARSDKPHLRARAEWLASQMWKYKILLHGMENLARTPEMKAMVRDVRERVEAARGPSNPAFRAAGRALHAAGRFREWRTARWGDAIQPPTIVRRYNWKNGT